MLVTPAPAGVNEHHVKSCDVTDEVLVLFGSQTGVALSAARHLHDQLKKASVSSSMGCLIQFEFYMARKPAVVVFVSSTFLDGGAPENAVLFKDFLDRDDPTTIRKMFSSVSYAVLGVGHSMWPKFCQFGKEIDERLAASGARRLQPRLDADSVDEERRQEDIERWIQSLVAQIVPMTNRETDIEETLSLCSASAEQCCHFRSAIHLESDRRLLTSQRCALAAECDPHDDREASPSRRDAHFEAARRLHGSGVRQAVLVHSAYICRAQQRRVLHLELEVTPDCAYEPGDCVAVPCANPNAIVRSLLSILDLKPSTPVSVPFVAGKCALSWALTFCLDICSAPSGTVLKALSRLSAAKNAGQLQRFCAGTRPVIHNMVDLFAKYSSLRPTADELVQLLDPLALRYYSIASSPYYYPNHIHLTVAISGDETPSVTPCTTTQGLCTGYLESCHAKRCAKSSAAVTIPFFIRSNRQLKLPCFDRPSSHALVMIGCGVGIAPFRAFLQHIPEGTVKSYLFFGFRDNQDDYLYKDEWGLSPSIELFEVAFSRLQSSKFRYVQDALRARANDLVELISSGAVFFVCGSLSMASDVYECFLSDILCGAAGLSRLEAIEAMEKKILQGRYMVEAWD